MNITIQGTNLSLTTKLRDFVEEKISDSLRPLGSLNRESVKIAVELEHTSNRYNQGKERDQPYKAEATVWLPGNTLRVEESAMDIEQAIVQLKHTLTRDIRKLREHLIESRRKGARQVKNLTPENGQQPAPEKTDAWVDEWNDAEIEGTVEEELAEEKEDWEENEIDDRDLV